MCGTRSSLVDTGAFMKPFGYLFTNLYMGMGIAADVYAATLGSFREFANDEYRRNWIWRNTLTHTVFPLVGMYAVIAGIAVWRPLQSLLFAAGGVLLGLFLRHLVMGKAGVHSGDERETLERKEGVLGELIGRVERIDAQWALVLGVSMDAVNSGFAKAADTRDWPILLLGLSFPLVGCVVGAGAWAGAQKAKWFLSFMQMQLGSDLAGLARRLAKLECWALVIELFVLGYFFWRSVASAIVPFGVPEWVDRRIVAWGLSALMSAIIFAIYGRDIVRNIRNRALLSFVTGANRGLRP